MAELTPEAKAEIAEAIRIVQEDKFAAFVRTTIGNHAPKDVPPTPPAPPTPPTPPSPPDGPTPPPPNPSTPPEPPTPPDPDKMYSKYWGEIIR